MEAAEAAVEAREEEAVVEAEAVEAAEAAEVVDMADAAAAAEAAAAAAAETTGSANYRLLFRRKAGFTLGAYRVIDHNGPARVPGQVPEASVQIVKTQ